MKEVELPLEHELAPRSKRRLARETQMDIVDFCSIKKCSESQIWCGGLDTCIPKNPETVCGIPLGSCLLK